jgi:hypothetical protein
MNINTFNTLLAHPQDISAGHDHALAQIIKDYPFFQSARALQLKGLKQADSYHYNKALKTTAVYTTDRDVLFDYITATEFSQESLADALVGHQESIKSLEVDHQVVGHQQTLTDTEPTNTSSETPELTHRPLEFQKEERHTFEQWLQLTQLTPIDRQKHKKGDQNNPNAQLDHPLTHKIDRINKFIANRPKLDPNSHYSSTTDLSQPFTNSPEEIMTETLARVYVAQKNYPKSIEAYKILILKYPEKSGFFADQIRGIEQLINAAQ